MSKKTHILVVDDDSEIRLLLEKFLLKHEFRVSSARDGQDLFRQLDFIETDLIVLDVMLPGDDGFTILKKIRSTSNVPIIMLTAAGEEVDRIIGLEMGADDYLPKPFNPRELLARIKSVLRRYEGASSSASADKLYFGRFVLDADLRDVFLSNGDKVNLSSGEFDILYALVKNYKKVLTRDKLLDIAKGRDAVPFDRSIDIQISRIRKKLGDDPKNPEIILTVRGGGYMFTPSVSSKPFDEDKQHV